MSNQPPLNFKFSLSAANPDVAKIVSFARDNQLEQAAAFAHARATEDVRYSEVLTALAAVQAAAGLLKQARENCERAIKLDAENPVYYAHLAYVLFASKDFADASRAIEQAIAGGRRSELDFCLASLCSLRTRQIEKAQAYSRQLVAAWPTNARNIDLLAEAFQLAGQSNAKPLAFRTAGTACLQRGQPKEALQLLEKARGLAPGDGVILSLLAGAHRELLSYGKAEECVRKAMELGEVSWRTANILGLILQETCRSGEALEEFRKATRRDPSDPLPHGNAVMAMHYNPEIGADEIRREIALYADKATSGADEASYSRRRSARKPLRVGLLSGSFHRHPATYLSLHGLEEVNKQAIRFFAYSNGGQRDDFTDRLKKLCGVWREIGAASDDNAAETIRADDLDILIDMAGSTQGRPGVIARKPAPVQVKWVGGLYNTTGIQAVDWLLADAAEVPEADGDRYSENIYRLPDGYVVYAPPDYAPPVKASPCAANGHVTFCSFNNPAKVNAAIVGVWSRILGELPDSRLILKGRGFSSSAARNLVHDWFGKLGIDKDRIAMEAASPHRKLLDTYNRSDIALDTWPYSGGLTTCEALWMGNPVVTMPGPTFAGRHSASHLTNIGRTEWIAESEDQYVEKAVSLARDQDALCETRRTLRQQVAASPLCDAERFARNFEKALIEMYEAS